MLSVKRLFSCTILGYSPKEKITFSRLTVLNTSQISQGDAASCQKKKKNCAELKVVADKTSQFGKMILKSTDFNKKEWLF